MRSISSWKLCGRRAQLCVSTGNREGGVAQGVRKLGKLVGRYRVQARAAQRDVQIAPLVAHTVDPAAVRPHLDAGQVLAQQALQLPPVPDLQV